MHRFTPQLSRGMKWAWSGALAVSLLVGCAGAEDATEDSAPVQAQEQAAAARPPTLRIASLEAIPLDTVITTRTRSRVRARLEQGQERLFKEIPIVADTGERVLLRDDGLNGDEKAGDLVFSAFAVVDLESHRKTQERISRAQVPLTWTTFDNRVRISERELRPLPLDIFKAGSVIPLTPAGLTTAVLPANSLIITHPNVVNDGTRTYDPCSNTGNPNGVWTFHHLMKGMASTFVAPADLTQHWLNQWNFPQSINNWLVPARTQMNTRILNPWPKVGSPLKLDMTKAPFKLVAIVNRLDLGKGTGPGGYGGSSGAGELRFVFAAVDKSAGCSIAPFLVIFEFGVPKNTCNDVRTWAQGWLNLSTLAIGSAAYNTALEALTQQVVVAGAGGSKPNGSAINQVRTNEIMLASPWELREFHLGTAVPNMLSGTTVALTPADPLNNTATPLAAFMNDPSVLPDILANNYDIPLTYPTAADPFRGANPRIPAPFSTFWNAPGVNLTARHILSFNACNGCHARETNTVFTHVDQFGGLSPFLATGMANMNNPFNVIDPVSGVSRDFFEIKDRAQHLDSVANQSCLIRRFDLPMMFVH